MIIFLHYVFACRFVFLLFKESPTGEIACTSARSLHSFLCSFVVRLATSPAANAMQRHDKSCFESCSNSRHWISFRSWFMPGLEALRLLQAWFDMCGAMCLRPAALLFVQHAERSTELRSSWETSMQLCTSCLAQGSGTESVTQSQERWAPVRRGSVSFCAAWSQTCSRGRISPRAMSQRSSRQVAHLARGQRQHLLESRTWNDFDHEQQTALPFLIALWALVFLFPMYHINVSTKFISNLKHLHSTCSVLSSLDESSFFWRKQADKIRKGHSFRRCDVYLYEISASCDIILCKCVYELFRGYLRNSCCLLLLHQIFMCLYVFSNKN